MKCMMFARVVARHSSGKVGEHHWQNAKRIGQDLI